MAGLTNEGLEIKRQGEVLTDLRTSAQPIFQDLVPPGDVVDTGNSSTIGRLTGLLSIPISDLWEAVQEVYLAFDPNSATGVALDNLVMYGGLTRNAASPTTADVVLWGNENLFLPAISTQVRSVNGNMYEFPSSVAFERARNIGFRLSVPSNVSVGATYGFSVVYANTTISAQRVAVTGDTSAIIVDDLLSQVASNPLLNSSVVGGQLVVETVDIYDYISLSVTNTIVQKIKTRAEVRNLEVGAIPQEANTINIIATPILGWDNVNNPFDAVTGEDDETDEQLRIRFRDSKFLRAQNIGDSLYAALLELDGVVSVGIFENESGVYDPVFDLPGHSFKAVVLGGDNTNIARIIWNNKPLGIEARGNTFGTIFDSQGFQRDIYFERPTPVNIYIDIELSVNTSQFPAEGVEQIKSAIIQYFQDNLTIGSDVIYSRLYTPINSVQGHQVNSLTIGTAPNPTGTANVPIPYNGMATVSSNNINITIT